MQMIKLSKTTGGLAKFQQRGNRSSVTSPPHPLPVSPSSSTSSSSSASVSAAVDSSAVADSLNIVESRVCRELMVDKFNRVSRSCQTLFIFIQYTTETTYTAQDDASLHNVPLECISWVRCSWKGEITSQLLWKSACGKKVISLCNTHTGLTALFRDYPAR